MQSTLPIVADTIKLNPISYSFFTMSAASVTLSRMMVRSKARRRRGQAMTEFMIVAGSLLAGLAILLLFKDTVVEYGGRVLNLVGSEYP